MNFFRLSLKNIQGSSFRSWVVFLCALIVAALSLSILLVGRGAEDSLRLAYERMGADIVVVPQGAESEVESALLMGEPAQVWMPAENLTKIAGIPGVAGAAPQIYLSTMEDAPCCAVSEMFIVVYDPATDFTVEPWLERELGRELGLGEAIGGRYVFVPPGERKIEMYGYYVDLKGNMEPTGTNLDQTMFLTMDTAREMARASQTQAMEELIIPVNSISSALIRVAPTASPDYVAMTIQKRVPGVTPLVGLSLFNSYRSQMSLLQQVMILILTVTSVLSLVLLSLVFSMAANERHRQIGVLRALGASRVFVFQSLVSEAASLAFIGGAVGVALGTVVVSLYGHFIVSALRLPFLIPAPATMLAYGLGGLGAALLCVILAAFLPAFRISRQDPAMAMRE